MQEFIDQKERVLLKFSNILKDKIVYRATSFSSAIWDFSSIFALCKITGTSFWQRMFVPYVESDIDVYPYRRRWWD